MAKVMVDIGVETCVTCTTVLLDMQLWWTCIKISIIHLLSLYTTTVPQSSQQLFNVNLMELCPSTKHHNSVQLPTITGKKKTSETLRFVVSLQELLQHKISQELFFHPPIFMLDLLT